jgi:hypothetical protein
MTDHPAAHEPSVNTFVVHDYIGLFVGLAL